MPPLRRAIRVSQMQFIAVSSFLRRGEAFFAEALPVADEARRKKGSDPCFKPQRGWNTAAATRANARPRYRVAARTRAPKRSTGSFFSLRSCPVRASSFQNTKKEGHPLGDLLFWSGRRGSNSLPRPWQGRALPDELRPHGAPTVFGQCHGASGRS